ncbi:MAG: hypothetical protein U1E61_08720 [Bradyrhizobium sp.]
MRGVTISATAAGLFAVMVGVAFAQSADTHPDRPIKVVVPAAAGGVTDTPARLRYILSKTDAGRRLA